MFVSIYTLYDVVATVAYAHSPVPNDMYLAVNDVYVARYKDTKGFKISRQQVLPVSHALQGTPFQFLLMEE